MKKRNLLSVIVGIVLIVSLVAMGGCTIDTTKPASESTNVSADQPEAAETAANAETTQEQTADTSEPATATDIVGVVDGLPVPSLEGKTIAIAAIGTDHGFDLEAYTGLMSRIEELGGTAIGVSADRDDQKGISDIENLIAQKPDAIVKMLGDATVYDAALAKVVEAGIPLFSVDFPSAHSISNATSDNYSIGAGLARKIFEDMGGEGKIAVFNGFYGIRVCGIRYDMLKYVAQDYPNIEFIEPELQDVIPGTVEDARKKIQDLLTLYPEGSGLKAIWAAWDIPSTGAAQAIDAAGRTDVKVYGVDGDETAVKMVADPVSSFAADMAQLPRKIGQASIDTVARYLAGEDVPSTVYVDPYLVTKANAEEAMKILGFAE